MTDALVRIVLPERSDDELSERLRDLTKAICEADPDQDSGYGLGGEYGYGCNFENEVFVMRKQWWGNCDCGFGAAEEAFSAKHGHENVPWQDFHDDGHAATCSLVLPNFRHKASGFEVRWYKWIGRDNEVVNQPADIDAVIAECVASLGSADPEELRKVELTD